MKNLLRKHPFLLTFSALQIFFSAPGQTFLIALFIIPIFEQLNISQSLAAGIYSGATLSAALLLNPAGRLIDKYPVQNIIKVVTVLMAIGCWILASASHVITIFIGFFILRLVGQGVFGLTASTLMIKQFEKNRGKALGLASLGFPASEAIYPFLGLFLLSTIGWRMSYVVFGISNILIMLPLQLFLLRRANIKQGEFLSGELGINPQRLPGNPEQRKIRPHRDFTLKEVLRDSKFYLILLASSLPPMIVTGLFFHQANLFQSNGWPISWAAGGLMAYALCKACGAVTIGKIVDEKGPFGPFIALIVLLASGTFLCALGGPKAIIFIYYCLIGTALGFSSPVANVIWPYFYGTKHIGSIKGFTATFRNGVTALAPLPIAIALDMGISINLVLKCIAGLIFLLSILPIIIKRLDTSNTKV